uniref:ATPase_AAA_core domain-containing protein n=1 Tax=Strongyloides venezuelensis TaxID=75913 RepID=A0A0K0FKL6_STRVS
MTKLFPIFNCKKNSEEIKDHTQKGKQVNLKPKLENERKTTKRKAPGITRKQNDEAEETIIILEDSSDDILMDNCNKESTTNNKKSRNEYWKTKVSEEITIISEIISKDSLKISEGEKKITSNKNFMYIKEMDYAPYSKLYHVLQNSSDPNIPLTYKFFFSEKTKVMKKDLILDESMSDNVKNIINDSFYVGHCPTPEETSKIYHMQMNNAMQSWYTYGAEARDIGRLSNSLLSSALKPDHINDFLNNLKKVLKLRKWMTSWKNKITNPSLFSRKIERNDDNESDSSKDSIDYMEVPFNPLIITGPSGVGKTSSIKFIASELEFNVISFGCDEKRNSTSLNTKLSGAISNFGMKSSKSGLQNFFKPVVTQSKTNNQKLGLTCIVIEDVDVIFEDDDGFWITIKNFCIDSKIPIILTCTQENNALKELSKFSSFYYRKSVLQFDHISVNGLTDLVRSLIFGSYKYYLNRVYLKQLIKEKKMDIRAILNHLHFILSTGLQPIFDNKSDFISEDISWYKKSYLMNEIADITSSNTIAYLPDFSEEYNREIYQSYCESSKDNQRNNAKELFNPIVYADIINNLKNIRFCDNTSRSELASDVIDALKIINQVFESKIVQSRGQNRRHPFTRLGEMIKHPIIANSLRLKLKYNSI